MNVELEFEKALEYMDEQNYVEAEKVFLAIDKIEPELVGTKMNLAAIEEIKGDTLKAISYLEAALKIEPNHPMIARRLADISKSKVYEDLNNELTNKVIALTSKEYFEAYRQDLAIVNDDYVKFDIKMTGVVIEINKTDGVIYLEGGKHIIEESVACYKVDGIIDSVKVGEEITIKGNSLGKGIEFQEPILLMKK